MVVLAFPWCRGVSTKPFANVRIEVTVHQFEYQLSPIFRSFMNRPSPVCEPAKLNPEFVRESFLPRPHFIFQVKLELHAKRVSRANKLVTSYFINRGIQTSLGDCCKELRRANSHLYLLFSFECAGIPGTTVRATNVNESSGGQRLHGFVRNLRNRDLDELFLYIRREKCSNRGDSQIAFKIPALIFTSKVVQRAGSTDHVPPVSEYVAGDFDAHYFQRPGPLRFRCATWKRNWNVSIGRHEIYGREFHTSFVCSRQYRLVPLRGNRADLAPVLDRALWAFQYFR